VWVVTVAIVFTRDMLKLIVAVRFDYRIFGVKGANSKAIE
jgi:hypothetical protein